MLTEGSKPVGAGIGPSEEAKDILAVLNGNKDAPQDLKERALFLSANLLDMDNGLGVEAGLEQATIILESGQALTQFNTILAAQGGRKILTEASHKHIEVSKETGVLTRIYNRKLARLAKLAGAPFSLNSGIRLHVNVDSLIAHGSALFTLYSDTQGELNYALDYYHSNTQMFQIEV